MSDPTDTDEDEGRLSTDLTFEELVKQVVQAEPDDTDASDED